MSADITIAGLGVQVPDHMTRETERAIRSCREVLFNDPTLATRPWLESLAPKVTDLGMESYREGRSRLNNYHHQAARVIEAALDHAPVVYLLQGHPMVFALPPRFVRAAAPLVGLTVATLPGISTLDCMFADLGLDPMDHATQMVEATDLLLRRRPLQRDAGLVLWQAGLFGTRLHTQYRSLPERYDPLRNYLLRFYPPDHPVTIYGAMPLALLPPTIHVVPLAELGADPDLLHPAVTLYFPPVEARPIADFDLVATLDDPEHLARVTRAGLARSGG